MADDGLVDRSVLDEFLFSLWFMTADEARQPLIDEEDLSPRIASNRSRSNPPPKRDPLLRRAARGSVAYADAYTGYIRVFADSTLRSQLLGPSAGDAAARQTLATEFFARVNSLYRTHLDEYAFELWFLTVVLQRR